MSPSTVVDLQTEVDCTSKFGAEVEYLSFIDANIKILEWEGIYFRNQGDF